MPIDIDRFNNGSKSLELPNLKNRPQTPKPPTDSHQQTANSAHQQSVQDKASLTVGTQKQLAGIQQSLEKIATDRGNAIEQVSDTLAYLYSPQTFQADVMRRTGEKLNVNQPEPETITLNSLGDCFSRFAEAVEYPAFNPASAMGGALPAAY